MVVGNLLEEEIPIPDKTGELLLLHLQGVGSGSGGHQGADLLGNPAAQGIIGIKGLQGAAGLGLQGAAETVVQIVMKMQMLGRLPGLGLMQLVDHIAAGIVAISAIGITEQLIMAHRGQRPGHVIGKGEPDLIIGGRHQAAQGIVAEGGRGSLGPRGFQGILTVVQIASKSRKLIIRPLQ